MREWKNARILIYGDSIHFQWRSICCYQYEGILKISVPRISSFRSLELSFLSSVSFFSSSSLSCLSLASTFVFALWMNVCLYLERCKGNKWIQLIFHLWWAKVLAFRWFFSRILHLSFNLLILVLTFSSSHLDMWWFSNSFNFSNHSRCCILFSVLNVLHFCSWIKKKSHCFDKSLCSLCADVCPVYFRYSLVWSFSLWWSYGAVLDFFRMRKTRSIMIVIFFS